MWVRIAAIAALAIVVAGVSVLFADMVPDWAIELVGAEAVNRVLEAITGSMLAVTIFSLSVMVSVHRAASGQWTPRVHRLLVADNVTMTAISVFIGAWLFALLATILQSVAYFGPGEAVILFAVTMAVVLLIVVFVIRWAVHLETLGSLEQTGARIEAEAARAMAERRRAPCLGCNPLTERTVIPQAATEVRAPRSGYVRHVYEAELDRIGRESGCGVYVLVPVGRFVAEGEAVAQAAAGEEVATEIARNVAIGDVRSFEQDPAFGLQVLSEVAQKALSPGVNDPGTATEMLGRILRVLEGYRDESGGAADPERSRVWMPPMSAADLVEMTLRPIVRDGAASLEVQVMVQRVLSVLSDHPDAAMRAAARGAAGEAAGRALAAMEDEGDRARLRAALPGGAAPAATGRRPSSGTPGSRFVHDIPRPRD